MNFLLSLFLHCVSATGLNQMMSSLKSLFKQYLKQNMMMCRKILAIFLLPKLLYYNYCLEIGIQLLTAYTILRFKLCTLGLNRFKLNFTVI